MNFSSRRRLDVVKKVVEIPELKNTKQNMKE